MSDRSWLSITIESAPDDDETRAKVAEIITDAGADTEFGDAPSIDDGLVLGQEYVCAEASIGEGQGVADALADLGVVARISQDPKYEWAGELYYVADGQVAAFGYESHGTETVDADKVRAALDSVPADADAATLRAAIDALIRPPAYLAYLAACETPSA